MLARSKVLFLIIFLFANCCEASIPDSLRQVISSVQHDSAKVDAFLRLGESMYARNLDSAITHWESASALAYKNMQLSEGVILDSVFTKYFAEAKTNLGYGYKHKGNYELAEKLYKEAIALLNDMQAINSLASAFNNLAVLYDDQGRHGDALDYYFKSLELHKMDGVKAKIATALNNIGYVYDNLGNVELALDYYTKALTLYQASNDIRGIGSALNNMGFIYETQGDHEAALAKYIESYELLIANGQKESAAYCLNNVAVVYSTINETEKSLSTMKRAKVLFDDLMDLYGVASTNKNIGALLQNKGTLDSAKSYLRLALKQYAVIGNKKGIVSTTAYLAKNYHLSIQLDSARVTARVALNMANELGYPENIQTAAEIMFNVSKEMGFFAEALSSYELMITMRDSIKNEGNQKATIKQQTKYEFEKEQLVKQQAVNDALRTENDKLKRRDNLQFSIIFIGLLLVFGAISGLGFISVSNRVAEALIFFSFLIFFEFLLVLADPYIDRWTSGAPGYKLLFNAVLAGGIFPIHAFFERKLKLRLNRNNNIES